jgi:hypothetical protein
MKSASTINQFDDYFQKGEQGIFDYFPSNAAYQYSGNQITPPHEALKQESGIRFPEIWEIAKTLAGKVSEEEWKSIPKDFASSVDDNLDKK